MTVFTAGDAGMVLNRFLPSGAAVELLRVEGTDGLEVRDAAGVAGVRLVADVGAGRVVFVGLMVLPRPAGLVVEDPMDDRLSVVVDAGFVEEVRGVELVGASDTRRGAPEIDVFFFSSPVSIELVDILGR